MLSYLDHKKKQRLKFYSERCVEADNYTEMFSVDSKSNNPAVLHLCISTAFRDKGHNVL